MFIRVATMEDLPALMDLYGKASDAMVGTPYDCCWRRDGHPSSEFVSSLVASDGMLVGTMESDLVAAIGIDHDLGHDYSDVAWLTDASPQYVAVLHLLVVAAPWRGKGLSRQLLTASLDVARSKGMVSARLDATANNAPAIELYASEGFQTVGRGWQDVGPADKPHVPFVVMERLLA